jgi:Holliday junction resolvase RusA-like endonuclease
MNPRERDFAVERRAVGPVCASALTLADLPVPPSAGGLKGARGASARYHAWRSAASWQIRLQSPRRVRGPVAITITLEDAASRTDLSSLAKAPIDLLCELQLIEGDHREVIREVTLRWGTANGMRIDVRSTP